MTPERITIAGREGHVIYLDDGWRVVPSKLASLARVLFDDGGSAFYTVAQERAAEFNPDQPRDEHGQWSSTDGGGVEKLQEIASGRQFYPLDQPNKLFKTLTTKDRTQYLEDFKVVPEARKTGASEQEMDITHLTATQKSIEVSQVKELVEDSSLAEGSEDGPPLLVTWHGRILVGDGHHRISAALLRGEKRMKVEYVDLDAYLQKYRSAAFHAEGPLHAAADSMVPRLSVAFRYAFANARRALRASKSPDAAITALRQALGAVLPAALASVVAAGGRVGAEGLVKVLRGVEFNPDQPRDEHGQWTSGGTDAFGTSDKFVYHISNPSVPLRSFERSGIKPSKTGQGGPGVYMANKPEATQYYEELGKGRLFRIDKEKLIERFGRYPEKKEGVEYDESSGEVLLSGNRSIPREFIEVEEAGKWRALGEFRAAKDEKLKPEIKFKFDAANPATVKWARRHAGELIDDISATSLERIRRVIADLTAGEKDWTASLDIVEDAVGDLDRAELIARNEAMRAANEGQRQAWDQAVDEGLLSENSKRTWITIGDDKVCPICEPLDGAVADLDGEYPGEGGDGPPAHVSCRCTEGISG